MSAPLLKMSVSFLILSAIFVITSSYNTLEPCSTTPLCTCNASLALCINVPYIPKLPRRTKAVIVEKCKFPNVTKETFRNLTSLNLTYLLINNNSILEISEDALADLPNITKLELGYEKKLRPKVIRDLLFNVGRNINRLIIRYFNWTGKGEVFPEDLFAGLRNTSIQYVGLIHNYMTTFNDSWFSGVEGVQTLDFTQNFLNEHRANFSKVSGLKTLILKMNAYKNFPNFCKDKVPDLRELDMMSNKLTDFYTLRNSLRCLKKLECLNVNGHSIRKIYSNTFSGLPSLRTLYVSEISQLYRLDGTAFNSSSLEELVFDDNGFKFSVKTISLGQTFNCLPKLQHLDISRNYLGLKNKDFRGLLEPLKELRLLKMFDMELWYLPYNLTQILPNLESLNVTKNQISNFNGKIIFGDKPTSIKHLDLSQNHISIVNQTTFPKYLLDNIHSLNLSRNPLSCSCGDIKWFYSWLQHTSNRRKIADLDLLLCQSPEHLKDRVLVSLSMGDICPLSEEMKNLIIGLSVSAGLILLVTCVLYLSRWHIRYWLFIVRSKRRQGYTRIPNDEDFTYDGFLVYAEEDRVFVHDILLPKLETQEGYRLCVHFRDFEAGKFIADNIVDNMNKSRKVIMVLSNSFAKSRWCDFELMIAQSRLISEESDLLLLILYKDIDFRHMSSKLRMLLTTMTYTKWSHDRAGEVLFWQMLKQGLQRPPKDNMNSAHE